MAVATSRLELKEWCLRQLGYPVIDINLADQQCEDNIDLAIQMFNEWHFDGSTRLYMKHQLTCTQLFFAAAIPVNSFQKGDGLTGVTSGATAVVVDQATNNLSIRIWLTNGTFVNGETINNISRSTQYILAATNALVLGDLDNQYIPMPDSIMSISKIFQISTTLTGNFLFNAAYYTMFDVLYNFGSLDMISYEILKERLNMIGDTFTGEKPIRFNRHEGKLYVDIDWKNGVAPDCWFVIDCWRVLDPNDYSSCWDNYFLKMYCVSLFRIQLGNNLSKFVGITLPGSITLDGPRILEQGKVEKAELEEQLKSGRWTAPMPIMIG